MTGYEQAYDKKFGIGQLHGIPEAIARDKYKGHFEQYLADGFLIRFFFPENKPYIVVHEIIAGTDKGGGGY